MAKKKTQTKLSKLYRVKIKKVQEKIAYFLIEAKDGGAARDKVLHEMNQFLRQNEFDSCPPHTIFEWMHSKVLD